MFKVWVGILLLNFFQIHNNFLKVDDLVFLLLVEVNKLINVSTFLCDLFGELLDLTVSISHDDGEFFYFSQTVQIFFF